MRRAAMMCGLALALVLPAAAPAASDLWFHVRVQEDGGSGAKVTVNLPLSMVEKAIPLLPEHVRAEAAVHLDRHEVELQELRDLWAELKSTPDMTFVTVEEEHGDNVRVWKEAGFLRVEVDEDRGDRVSVRVPQNVVDALLAGDELDLEAAVRALVDFGEGEIVTVNESGNGDQVRVWIDRRPEAAGE